MPIKRGKLAFISQSAAVSNTILDWAQQRKMGFSYFIALGDSTDIDVDELLDYLARDSKTSAILLYLEQLSDARRFVSAARSASRNKPILVIKSGRSPAAQRLLNTTAGMDPHGMRLFSVPVCCGYRTPTSCFRRWKPLAICARYVATG